MGDLIPRELQEYIWVPRILQLLHRIVNPLTTLPDPGVENPLKYVIEGLQNITGENALSGVFLLGMYRSVPLIRPPILYTTSSLKWGEGLYSNMQLVSNISPPQKVLRDRYVHFQ